MEFFLSFFLLSFFLSPPPHATHPPFLFRSHLVVACRAARLQSEVIMRVNRTKANGHMKGWWKHSRRYFMPMDQTHGGSRRHREPAILMFFSREEKKKQTKKTGRGNMYKSNWFYLKEITTQKSNKNLPVSKAYKKSKPQNTRILTSLSPLSQY